MNMNEKLFNSFFQACLVKGYGWVARLIDLETGFCSLIYQRIYFSYKRFSERDTLQFIERVTYPGSLVIDIGANIGFFSLETCRLPDRRIIAFEPEPKNYKNLLSNLSKAGYENFASCHCLALSNHSGRGKLYLSDLAPTDHKIIGDGSDESIEVEFMRLDDFLITNQSLFDRPISLLKIDVQGAELMVCEGMVEFLRVMNWPVLLVEYTPTYLNLAGVKRVHFLEFFMALGYRFYKLSMQQTMSVEQLLQFDLAYMDIVMVHKNSKILESDFERDTDISRSSGSN